MSSRYGLIFLLLALAAVVVARPPASLPVRGVGWAAALAFGLVALAYFWGGPKVLLKRPDGRRPRWAWLIFCPYLVLNELAWGLACRAGREAPFDTVAPNLFLGRRLSACEARRLGPGWVAVLDLAAEFAEVASLRAVAAYASFPVLDATAPSLADLAAAVSWLRVQTQRGPTFVHCALGHGRSATVVAAYLLATDPAATPDSALEAIRAVRPGVALNAPQRARLAEYAALVAAPGPPDVEQV